MTRPPKKLLEQVRDAIRRKHYSIRTEQSYVDWIRRFILYHNKRHPRDMGSSDVEAFLTYLAVEQNVAAAAALPSRPKTRRLARSSFYIVMCCTNPYKAR